MKRLYNPLVMLTPILLTSLLVQHPADAQSLDSLKKALKAERSRTIIYKRHLRKHLGDQKYIFRRAGRNIRDVVFDFDSKQFVNDPPGTQDTIPNPPFEIHEMDGIRIKIKNINPFNYSVDLYELQGDQISNEKLRESTQSSALKLDVPMFKELNLSALVVPKQASKDSGAYHLAMRKSAMAVVIRKKIDSLEEKKRVILDEFATTKYFIENKYDFNAADTLNETAVARLVFENAKRENKVSGVDARIKELNDRMTNEDLDEKSLQKLLSDASAALGTNRAITASNAIREKLSTEIRNLQTALYDVNKFIFLHNQMVSMVTLSINNVDSLQLCLNALFNGAGIDKPKEFPFKYLSAQKMVLEKCDQIFPMIHQLKMMDTASLEQITIMEMDLRVFHSSFKEFDHSRLVNHVLAINGLITPRNFELTYETLSIVENADYVKYRIEFKPIATTDVPQSTGPFSLEMSFLVNEGLKVDVSTGMILDFDLADPKYYFSRFSAVDGAGDTFDSVRVVKSPDTGNVTPSINMMLNAYKRSSINFKPGFSFGFGVSNDIRFRLYAGPSLIVGRKERIMINGGVAFGAILRHADGYKEGTTFPDNAAVPAEVPMIQDKFKFGWYVGVGFNLSGRDTRGFVEKIKFK